MNINFTLNIPYAFNVDFEQVNPVNNRSALKIDLLMCTSSRGHTLAQAGFVSKSSETAGDIKPKISSAEVTR